MNIFYLPLIVDRVGRGCVVILSITHARPASNYKAACLTNES